MLLSPLDMAVDNTNPFDIQPFLGHIYCNVAKPVLASRTVAPSFRSSLVNSLASIAVKTFPIENGATMYFRRTQNVTFLLG